MTQDEPKTDPLALTAELRERIIDHLLDHVGSTCPMCHNEASWGVVGLSWLELPADQDPQHKIAHIVCMDCDMLQALHLPNVLGTADCFGEEDAPAAADPGGPPPAPTSRAGELYLMFAEICSIEADMGLTRTETSYVVAILSSLQHRMPEGDYERCEAHLAAQRCKPYLATEEDEAP